MWSYNGRVRGGGGAGGGGCAQIILWAGAGQIPLWPVERPPTCMLWMP